MADPTAAPRSDLGVGLVSVGWMGRLHSRAYQALPSVYPETGIRPRLVHVADTAPDRVDYATGVLGRRPGHLRRLQLPARPGRRAQPRAGGRRRPGPGDEPPGGVLHRLHGRPGPVGRRRPGAGGGRHPEASRAIVGPQCGIGFEIYGTDGSLVWNFERMNELLVCLGRGGEHQGYTTVLANDHLGDYARFQPGPGIAMGYDDLKVVEAKKFLVAVAGGERRNSTVDDALSAAEVVTAAERSAADGTWRTVPPVPGSSAARRA
jgi:predicted dehydrogenase